MLAVAGHESVGLDSRGEGVVELEERVAVGVVRVVLVDVVAVSHLHLDQVPQSPDKSSEARNLVLNSVHDVLHSKLLD